jgi:hypothetical protein
MYIFVNKETNIVFGYNYIINQAKDCIHTISGLTFLPEEAYDIVTVESIPKNYADNKFNYIDGVFSYANVLDENTDLWVEVRQKRDLLLEKSDRLSKILWQDIWINKTEEYKAAWISYRAQLRDIPATFEFAKDVTWPSVPEI